MSRARILVVDDNPVNLKLASEVLAAAGFEIDRAVDAESAIEVIARAAPALILMDINLPGMDGLTLTSRLKADPATRAIRIVALTALAMKGDDKKAFAAGCDGYIAKPIDTRRLADQVAEVLAHPATAASGR